MENLSPELRAAILRAYRAWLRRQEQLSGQLTLFEVDG